MFKVAHGHRHPLRQLQSEGVLQIARNARRVLLAERGQNLVLLRPVQIAQCALRDAGFFLELARCRGIDRLAPFEAAGDRLPESGRHAPFEQQKLAAGGINHDQYRFRASKRLQVGAYSTLGGRRTRMCNSFNCASLTSVGASINGSAAVWVFGNAMTSRMLSAPAISIASRSRPKAMPPWGGAPNLSASSKKPNLRRASSGEIPNKSNTTDCSSWLWMRTEPPPISEPLSTRSYALAIASPGLAASAA